jgi:hypothetical protein
MSRETRSCGHGWWDPPLGGLVHRAAPSDYLPTGQHSTNSDQTQKGRSMFKSLATKLAGIAAVIALVGSLAAGSANANSIPTGSDLCSLTGPQISTVVSGSGSTEIRATCFPREVRVCLIFDVSGGQWQVWYYPVTASDGSFTFPMVWAPQANVADTESVEATWVNDEATESLVSNTLSFTISGIRSTRL